MRISRVQLTLKFAGNGGEEWVIAGRSVCGRRETQHSVGGTAICSRRLRSVGTDC